MQETNETSPVITLNDKMSSYVKARQDLEIKMKIRDSARRDVEREEANLSKVKLALQEREDEVLAAARVLRTLVIEDMGEIAKAEVDGLLK